MREFKQLFNQTTVHQRSSADRFLGKGVAPKLPVGDLTFWVFKRFSVTTEEKSLMKPETQRFLFVSAAYFMDVWRVYVKQSAKRLWWGAAFINKALAKCFCCDATGSWEQR